MEDSKTKVAELKGKKRQIKRLAKAATKEPFD